jgi:hypothetical protein
MVNFTWGRRTLFLIIITLFRTCKSTMVNFTWGRRTLLLIIITLFKNCEFQYLIYHVNTKTLTTSRVTFHTFVRF